MRLTPEQAAIIRHAAQASFGPRARVLLFGSRTDDGKRGGDIDLLVKPDKDMSDSLLLRKIRFLGLLERALGEQRIDVVIEHEHDPRPIVEIARQTGIEL